MPALAAVRPVVAGAAAAVAAAAIWCSPALADYPVVSATVYPGASGSVATRQVSASALGSCQPYSGSSTMYMSPSGNDETVPSSSWALSTIVTCGLQVPLSNVSQVQVASPSRGFEAPLGSADLATPSPYQDPSAQPLVATDGSQDQNTYIRPWLGGSDQNARDQVTEDGAPVTIIVYEHGAMLTVRAQDRIVSRTHAGMTVDFTAGVTNAQGASVPAAALKWAWSFGDAGTSAAAAPAHRYAASGIYDVTVQVTDPQNGSGGTDSVQVRAPTAAASGAGNHPGAGHNRDAKSPAGPTRSSGTHAGAAAGRSKGSGTPSHSGAAATGSRANTSSATTQAAPTSPAAAAPVSPTAPVASHAAPHRPPVARAHRPPRAAIRSRGGRLVVGRLVSDVVPLTAANSSLVHSVPAAAASAPTVRRAAQTTSLTGVAAGIAVALLLGLGAARERRGRRSWRTRPS